MKLTSLHIKNMPMKQFCNRKVRDFAMALRARKVSGTFEKRAPGLKARVLAYQLDLNISYRVSLQRLNAFQYEICKIASFNYNNQYSIRFSLLFKF